jgi:hypothetical protein
MGRSTEGHAHRKVLPVPSPAACRRNANLLAACSTLIADAARAAAGLYQALADAPDGQVALSRRELARLAADAAPRLDRARRLDRDRWPDKASAEAEAAGRMSAERAVLAEVEATVDAEPALRPPVPEHGPAATAAMAVPAAAEELRELVREEADGITAEQVRRVAADYHITPAELLDETTSLYTSAACLILQHAADTVPTDPSAAAEVAVVATSDLATAVTLASLDAR